MLANLYMMGDNYLLNSAIISTHSSKWMGQHYAQIREMTIRKAYCTKWNYFIGSQTLKKTHHFSLWKFAPIFSCLFDGHFLHLKIRLSPYILHVTALWLMCHKRACDLICAIWTESLSRVGFEFFCYIWEIFSSMNSISSVIFMQYS